ncbi:MAG: ferredoxin [Chloroflexota bacterium]
MAARVQIDEDLCIGSGECVRLLPAAFRIDESRGISVPLDGAPLQDLGLLVLAGHNCPTNSIRVVADDGTVLVDSAH